VKELLSHRFHLVFSMLMGAMMVFLMTFVITLVNIGWKTDFVRAWAKALYSRLCDRHAGDLLPGATGPQADAAIRPDSVAWD
jgi:hypothetical protein